MSKFRIFLIASSALAVAGTISWLVIEENAPAPESNIAVAPPMFDPSVTRDPQQARLAQSGNQEGTELQPTEQQVQQADQQQQQPNNGGNGGN